MASVPNDWAGDKTSLETCHMGPEEGPALADQTATVRGWGGRLGGLVGSPDLSGAIATEQDDLVGVPFLLGAHAR